MEAVAAGKFQGLEKLVTKKIGLEDLVENGIKALIAEKDTQSELCFIVWCHTYSEELSKSKFLLVHACNRPRMGANSSIYCMRVWYSHRSTVYAVDV